MTTTTKTKRVSNTQAVSDALNSIQPLRDQVKTLQRERDELLALKAKPLSEGALSETARALADRGDDYGWNVYYKGALIAPATLRELAQRDPGVLAWYEAFRAAIAAYESAMNRAWTY